MEADYHKLKAAPSLKFKNTAAAISHEGSAPEIDELPRYTSLKDVIANHSPCDSCGSSCPNSGEIAIRNELVKHAAAAYLLSAYTAVNPASHGGDSRMFESMRAWRLCWPFANFVYRIVHRVRNCLIGVVELS